MAVVVRSQGKLGSSREFLGPDRFGLGPKAEESYRNSWRTCLVGVAKYFVKGMGCRTLYKLATGPKSLFMF
jgi:hypothetical protein